MVAVTSNARTLKADANAIFSTLRSRLSGSAIPTLVADTISSLFVRMGKFDPKHRAFTSVNASAATTVHATHVPKMHTTKINDTACDATRPMLFRTSSWYDCARYTRAPRHSTFSVKSEMDATAHRVAAPSTAPICRIAKGTPRTPVPIAQLIRLHAVDSTLARRGVSSSLMMPVDRSTQTNRPRGCD